MTIDTQVHRIARQFSPKAESFEQLLQAVVLAEGGIGRILRAVQCSVPDADTVDEALIITGHSAIHMLSDYVKAHDAPGFVAAFGAKWAPQGARNDPNDLNTNWPHNVLSKWLAAK